MSSKEHIVNTQYYKYIRRFLEHNKISVNDYCLVVCGGQLDYQVFLALGFKKILITNLADSNENYPYERQDAMCLSYQDAQFDNVIVHAGLHHCSSPHRALTEMYRVAKKNVIVFEAQDTLLVKLFVKLGFVEQYEIDAVIEKKYISGGCDNLPIPNHVYRWKRNEITKLIRSYDPYHEPNISFYREFLFHPSLINTYLGNNLAVKILGKRIFMYASKIFIFLANLFFSRQGNLFVVFIDKQSAQLLPWIERKDQKFHMIRKNYY
jgi:SAM-dependent methyltransferase